MSRKRTRGSTFADMAADLRTNPDPRWVRIVERPHWRGPDGTVYLPWTGQLSPTDAVAQLRHGARVVYDASGRGGDCDMRWLTTDELNELKSSPPPDLHPSKHGPARLEGWRSRQGDVLVVVVCEVSWGGVIRG